ncbi:MAG: 16S rRNA (cytosine(967)-C(5))-methyltransferase RsmB [Chitinispirillales bacterium]|jgi:16S rRNA (cytosine967-C5)-methyltransferase|nr:16S rRNA (cytosine(967)-C(5))-methyltransferase RsmB [Chitinispirillales bacterium]
MNTRRTKSMNTHTRRTKMNTRQTKSMNTREFVLKVLSDFDSKPGDLERLTDRALSNIRIEYRDRRFVFELVYGVIRNRIFLDYVINKFIVGEHKLDTVRRILQIGSYQIIFLDRVPDHAAVNESVNLAKMDRATEAASGLVNAVLRNVIKNKRAIALPDPKVDLCAYLSVEYSHPKWMIERWLSRYGLSNTKKILSFNNERPSIYLRRKIHDISRQQFESDVRTLCDQAAGYLNLYYRMRKALDPENLRLLHNGFCTVQAPSSGWTVALMDVRPRDSVVDLCSAPGGKSTLMAEIMGESGSVFACDKSINRLRMVSDTARKLNLVNIHPLLCDSAAAPFKVSFDKVLLDAPCSATGVLQRHPDGRFVRTACDIDKMHNIQRGLLTSAAKLTKEGGVLVYSTCSLEPEENEQQVEWFLKEHPEFTLETPPDAIPAMFIDNNNCLRITPFEHGMDGMFGARFRKTGK